MPRLLASLRGLIEVFRRLQDSKRGRAIPDMMSDEAHQILRKMVRRAWDHGPITTQLRRIIPPTLVQVGPQYLYLYPRENYTDLALWLDQISPEDQSLTQLEDRVTGCRALILDIGANCGSYTVRLAAAAGAASRILAFEPHPVMAGRLRHNLALNNLPVPVEVHECALSDRDGHADLSVPAHNFGEATLRPDARTAGQIVVRTARLERFLAGAADYDRVVIKIDVEGFEDRVLGPILSKHWTGILPDDILIETCHQGNWALDLISLLTEKGYQRRFEGEGNTLFSRVRT